MMSKLKWPVVGLANVPEKQVPNKPQIFGANRLPCCSCLGMHNKIDSCFVKHLCFSAQSSDADIHVLVAELPAFQAASAAHMVQKDQRLQPAVRFQSTIRGGGRRRRWRGRRKCFAPAVHLMPPPPRSRHSRRRAPVHWPNMLLQNGLRRSVDQRPRPESPTVSANALAAAAAAATAHHAALTYWQSLALTTDPHSSRLHGLRSPLVPPAHLAA